MKLIKLARYRDLVYVKGSAPSMDTLRKRITEIPGGQVQFGKYYVDLDVNSEPTTAQKRIAELRGNPLLKGLV